MEAQTFWIEARESTLICHRCGARDSLRGEPLAVLSRRMRAFLRKHGACVDRPRDGAAG